MDRSQEDGPYEFRHGDVWYVLRDPKGRETTCRHVCSGTEAMGVAYDADDGVLHKHGKAENVERWATETRRKLTEAGGGEMAAALNVVTFLAHPAPVAELNACIATTGRISGFPDRLAGMADEVGEAPAWTRI